MPRRGDSDALHGISVYLQINITKNATKIVLLVA
jgi:hypothetical protein